jgi:hypothetical protein
LQTTSSLFKGFEYGIIYGMAEVSGIEIRIQRLLSRCQEIEGKLKAQSKNSSTYKFAGKICSSEIVNTLAYS